MQKRMRSLKYSSRYGLILDVGRNPYPTLLCAQRRDPAENPGFWRLLETLTPCYTILTHRPQAESRFLDLGG